MTVHQRTDDTASEATAPAPPRGAERLPPVEAGGPTSGTMRGAPRRSGPRPAQRRTGGRGRAGDSGDRLGRGLGWFSLGLGLAQVAAPGALARLIGVPDTDDARTLLRIVGVRELAVGAGLLDRPRSGGYRWARAAGDVIDLGLLARALTMRRAARGRVLAALATVASVTALDLFAATRASGRLDGDTAGGAAGDGVHTRKVVTIYRPPDEVYRFWRDLENLPRFMGHLESVQALGGGRSRWRARGPAGMTVEWDAEIVADRPNELIAWRSLPSATVEHRGVVHFRAAPGRRGTEVAVELTYRPPAGAAGAALAQLFGAEPGQEVQADLRLLKQVLETGDVTRSDASIHAWPHPARPPAPESGR